jgi:hypothetical protein
VLFIGVQLWEIQILRKSVEAEIDFTRRRIQQQLSGSSSEAKQLPPELEELLLKARGKSFSSIIKLGQRDGAGSLALSP